MDAPETPGQAAAAKLLAAAATKAVQDAGARFCHTRVLVNAGKTAHAGTCAIASSAYLNLGAGEVVTTVAEALAFAEKAEALRLAGQLPRERLVEASECPAYLLHLKP